MSYKSRRRAPLRTFVIILCVFTAILGAVLYVKTKYTVTHVIVNGNSHYTDDQIRDFVMRKPYEFNSLYLRFKYDNQSVEDIPFVEKMDVEIVSADTIKINVYEKAMAGYVEYLGHYMYFDKDGVVVESSSEKIPGIPFVTGLKFNHVVLHEPLPVKDSGVFLQILNIAQLLNKYEISTDRIAFDTMGNITLYFGKARVSLGSNDYIDEKINEMHLLLAKLYGYSGVLHMENYTGEEVNFSFDKDEDSDAVENIFLEEDGGEESSAEGAESSAENENGQ